MSTAITSVFDALVTRISTILPNHIRLTNPYDIAQNNERYLKQGWGLGLGPAVNTRRFNSCQFTTQRDFILSITRQYYARESDVASKATTEKEIFEDLYLVSKDIQKHNTLNDGLYIVTYQGDNGIQSVFSEKDVWLYVQVRITVDYTENFT